MDRVSALFEIKAVDSSQRIIEGYASVFGNVDKVGDVVDPAAFADTLRRKAPGDIAVFIGHQASTLPVGEPLEIRADERGLFTKTLVLDGPVGDQLLSAAKKGLLGMSIGYVPLASRPDTVGGRKVRRLTNVDLHEYSFAAKAMIANPDALVTAVKTEGAMGDLPDSAYAHVEPGTLDTEQKTVPRANRHLPHHRADGSVDDELVRAAIAEAAGSPHAAKALPHLLRHAAGHDDADAPVWAEGAAPALLVIAHGLAVVAERMAAQCAHMAGLGDDTKSGWLTRATVRQEARELAAQLDALLDRAEGADTGADVSTLSEIWRMQRELLEV